MTAIEISAIEAYLAAIESGDFKKVSPEMKVVTPMAEALAHCNTSEVEEIALAQQEREDYLFDANFLRYLRSM